MSVFVHLSRIFVISPLKKRFYIHRLKKKVENFPKPIIFYPDGRQCRYVGVNWGHLSAFCFMAHARRGEDGLEGNGKTAGKRGGILE